MAYSAEFFDEGRGVKHVAGGVVTGEEVLGGAVRSLERVRDGVPLSYSFIDFTDIDRFAVSAEDIRDIARVNLAIAQIRHHICVAVVAPSDHAYGMARMWEAYADATAWETRVFRQRERAMAWLDEKIEGSPGEPGA